ncbi:YopJ family acetyltransferase [Pantoea vagans]|uniref:YopJ family acetyltransferase n=1 Tax=Pantoea vagans TaxID=470934 RepID=UPI00076B44B9|nr:YopJ family acetyltransferase [Pantoea vagans]AMG56656.1 avirulence protein [Pantoea vagans]
MNIFRAITGNKSPSQQPERTPTASPQASPLPAGRAGRLQRQNAMSPDVRYNASATQSTPDRARATTRHRGEASSSSAQSAGEGSMSTGSSLGLIRQSGRRENTELVQFHDMMQSSSKMSRSDPLPQNPERLPGRLQQKMDTVNLPKLKKLDKDLYDYAKLATDLVKDNSGTNVLLTRLDKKMMPLIADAENARHPDLNLHVFKGPDECYKAIKEQNKQVWNSRQPGNMRVVFAPAKGMPDHHIALDIQLRPGHRPSIVCFESALGNMMDPIKQGIEQGLKGARVKMVGNFIQASSWDCAMFALNNALKSFKHYDDYTSRLHAGEQNVPKPSEFFKHAQSKSHIEGGPRENDIVSKDKGGLHAETLLHRNLAYRAQRFDKAYSTSIEGFRFQEIERAGEYLAAQRGRR